MTGAPINLTTIDGGMNLLRQKGSAPRNNLRLLLNGYVDETGGGVIRPGTVGVSRASTNVHRGFVAHDEQLWTFAHTAAGGTLDWADEAGMPAVDTIVLINPNDATSAIREIWYAGAYMGLLYVVAEYANGDVFHFWLEGTTTWQPNKIYLLGDLVEPDGPTTGYAYRVTRTSAPFPPWAPGDARALGDKIEPTVPKGWYYEVTNTIGDTPRSGQVEPVWPEENNAVVWEDVDGVGTAPPSTPVDVPDTALPPSIGDRYDNMGGGGGVNSGSGNNQQVQ